MTEKQYFTLLNLLKANKIQISKIMIHPISEIWLTKLQVKQIFGYSENSLRSIEGHLEISKKKGRKFYSTQSVLKYIDSGLIHSELNPKQNNNSL
jgi:hypothetical protein